MIDILTYKFFELSLLWGFKLFREILILIKIAEKVDRKDVGLVQFVTIASLDSILSFLRLIKLKEEVAAGNSVYSETVYSETGKAVYRETIY